MADAPRWLSALAEGPLDEVREAKAGKLVVTSGKIAACDPLVFLRGADPFARRVKPGEHPVYVGRLHGENAFARIDFRPRRAAIASWEVARCPGEEEVEGWPGYGVDSGLGCFVDIESAQRYREREDEVGERVAAKVAAEGIDPTDVMASHDAFERHRLEEGPDPLAQIEEALGPDDHAAVVLDEETGGNLVAFRAGTGDGVYASFWGLDAKKQPLCLVTDFGLLEGHAQRDAGLGTSLDSDLHGDLDGEDDEDDEDDAGFDDLGGGLGDLGDLEALAAALASRVKPEPEATQGPSPLFLQARDLLLKWVKAEKIELEDEVNLDVFAEAFLEKLVSLQGHRRPGTHIADWLLDRGEVADVFASDDELEADLRG